MQDKTPRNEEGLPHGYWEIYHSNGQLDQKGLYINGTRFGRHESYWQSGDIYFIDNLINDELHGYYEFHYSNVNIDKEYYAR